MEKRILLVAMVVISLVSVSSVAFSATHSYYLPYFIGHTNHWTGIGVSNCGSSSATVNVFVYDTDGNLSENDTLEIAPRGHDVFLVGDDLPDEGWVRINSTQPLVGLCFVATTGTDNYMADIPFASELSPLLYIPHVGQGPVYDTCIMVCNPNSTDTIVTLTFVDQQGNRLHTKSQAVDANGSWRYELGDMLDSSTANYGSVEISASDGLAAFALYDNRKKNGYSYAGISAVVPPGVSGSHSYYLPYFIGHTNHWTGIGLSNCCATSSAAVDVFVYDSDGNLSETVTLNIAPRGHDVFLVGDDLPNEGWVRINSTQPLVGLCFVATTGASNYMADIPFASELSPLLFIPHVGQGPVYDTCVMVCNPNPTDTIVTLTFVDQQGNQLHTESRALDANGSWRYDLGDMLDSSTANYGSVEISASDGLAAFALYDNRKKGGYSYAGISAVEPPPGSCTSGDIDNDGDGLSENQGDLDDSDAGTYPGAPEVCGDGIDQDGDGSDDVCEPGVTYTLEDFDNGSGGGFLEYPPFYFSNDRFEFRGNDSYYYNFTSWNGGSNPSWNWHPNPVNSNYFDDFNVSVMTDWDSGSSSFGYGLSVCLQENPLGGVDAIDFEIVKDGYYIISRATNSSYETLVSWTPSFLPNIDGQNNKLAIEKEDDLFRFFINDVEVEQLEIEGLSGGGIGLGSTGVVDVSFDDFKVTEPFEGQLVIPSTGYLEKLKELVYKVMTTTYFWYDTVPEVDLATYTSAEELLDDLRYDEFDKWSYLTPKEDYDNLFEEGRYIGSGFGMKYSDTGEVLIKYVYEDSPAGAAGLSRGDRLLEVNGKTMEEIETGDLWETVFGEDEIGTPVTLKIEDTSGLIREMSFEKDWVIINTVLYSDVLNVGNQKIGYLVFNEFLQTSLEELDPLFTNFKQETIDELILDLRYNPGGRGNVQQHLSELIAGEHVEGGVYEEFVHNDKYAAWDFALDYSTTIVNSVDLERVVVITTGESCSASEGLINSLTPYIDVVVIGDTTCGKPVGMYGYDLFDMHISPIEFKAVNADGEGDYFDGIDPTCYSDDDLTKQFGDTQESSLSKALDYIRQGSCSAGTVIAGATETKGLRKEVKEVPMKGFRREIGAF